MQEKPKVKVSHSETGTSYGEQAALYKGHGPDGPFADVKVFEFLSKSSGQVLVDVGAGKGPFAIKAAQMGARQVFALDVQENMLWGVNKKGTGELDAARKAVEDEKLGDIVQLIQGDAALLPLPTNFADKTTSILVGCNLPNTHTITHEGDNNKVHGLGPHFLEMARVLKTDGQALVVAPTSFEVVFTNGERPKNLVMTDINYLLSNINDYIATLSNQPNKQELEDNKVKDLLGKLTEVNRATFAKRNGQWALIENEGQLISGEVIWRKIPGLVVPNYYHSEAEYLKAAEDADLKLVEEQRSMFSDESERNEHNIKEVETEKRLGPEYCEKPPFAVWVFKKP